MSMKSMSSLTIKITFAGILLSSVLIPAGRAQQPTNSSEPETVTSDPIVGSWKLDINKSTNPTVESELLTITREGLKFQLMFQATQSNGYNPQYQTVTDMNGTISSLVQTDGKPMSDEWRITRNQPNAFVVESVGRFGGSKQEYAVSSDGKTLTVHDLPGSPRIMVGVRDSDGTPHPIQQVLVFARISDSERRSLSKSMAESIASRQAQAAQKAAAVAALDATACSETPGQSRATDSLPNQGAWHEYVCPKDGFGIALPNAPHKQSLEHSDFFKLFMTEDESIVAQLWVSAGSVDCANWLPEMRKMVNQPIPPGAVRTSKETTFQNSPALETVDRNTNGPQYLLYDLRQCRANRTYDFHARWLSDQRKPEEVTRIFSSFRLLTIGDNENPQ